MTPIGVVRCARANRTAVDANRGQMNSKNLLIGQMPDCRQKAYRSSNCFEVSLQRSDYTLGNTKQVAYIANRGQKIDFLAKLAC